MLNPNLFGDSREVRFASQIAEGFHYPFLQICFRGHASPDRVAVCGGVAPGQVVLQLPLDVAKE